ncbi:hypothetical protein RB195_013779 [Necator americanus]|uniref:Uncharacterized protein n=1 Tax=Necator americanus TaxID=51031 RepID=A0ABR1DX54_NECAM
MTHSSHTMCKKLSWLPYTIGCSLQRTSQPLGFLSTSRTQVERRWMVAMSRRLRVVRITGFEPVTSTF